MAQMTLPAAPNYKRTSYSGLLGCDFSVDPSLVDRRHSPDCLNMISDNGGNPIKRKGWEIVNNSSNGKIENIWSFYAGQRYIIFTSNNNGSCELHCITESGNEVELADGGVSVASGKHCAFYTDISESQVGFYLIDGTKYHRIYSENNSIRYEEVSPKVPTVLISRSPNGGGEVYEDINLLTRERVEQFLNTAGNTTFVLSSPVDTTKEWSAYYQEQSGNETTWVKDTGATVNEATVTMSAAHAPIVTGQDNIKIQYFSTNADRSGDVLSSTSCAHFSSTAQDQIFLTGNSTKPNNIYYSAPNDITYFPDLNYLNIGGVNKIMGFLNLGEYLAVVKEGTSDDSTIFLIYQTSIRSTTVSASDGKTTTTQDRTFAVKRSTAGIGAISKYCFGVLNDEPLFLSAYGVYGVISTNITSEKIARNRSYYVDPKLTAEPDIADAVSTVWNNYYIIAANGSHYENVTKVDEDGNEYVDEVPQGHMYVFDGRHKGNNSRGNTNYGYEAYYWEGIPAICVTSYDKELWFGTPKGEVCRFKSSGNPTDYSDGTMIGETTGGRAITARWATPNDNDGLSEYYKTMNKKGTMCTVAPFNRSSVKVYLSVDGYTRGYIGMAYVDISGLFDGEIDFGRLSFDSRTTPRDFFFKKKQKKYQRIQIILENDEINEPFGIFEIVKTYTVTKFAKNSDYTPNITPSSADQSGYQTHTITIELEDDSEQSMGFNGTRWK